jgi:hypothetical protein
MMVQVTVVGDETKEYYLSSAMRASSPETRPISFLPTMVIYDVPTSVQSFIKVK